MRTNILNANNRFEKFIESNCFEKINQKLNSTDDRIEYLATSLKSFYEYKTNLEKKNQ